MENFHLDKINEFVVIGIIDSIAEINNYGISVLELADSMEEVKAILKAVEIAKEKFNMWVLERSF